ncbi:MAG: glucose-6-phosphate isomerase [Planctomycetota bacterium]
MSDTASARFDRFLRWRCALAEPPLEVDFALSGLEEGHVDAMRPRLTAALEAMQALEGGAIANPDEGRMVGHYWLRAPELAPEPEMGQAIREALAQVKALAADVHSGAIAPPEGGRFRHAVLVGIGGSALGPMLVADALGAAESALSVTAIDNTDPDGIDRTLARLGSLREVMVLVTSKSGSTPETRNGMLEVQHACRQQGLDFAKRAIAITQEGSALAQRADAEGWIARFPMWDWVGGRTSELSAVGLLPAALHGVDVDAMLAGARAVDAATREPDPRHNPAALLALWWHAQSNGRGERAMVVLPYKDRLLLLSRYLQQLVMESLGKQLDRKGKTVHQGLTVYGNKGSTDQHAYVQQLRDGRPDFFAVFVRELRDRDGPSIEVEEGATSGDFLHGFLLGTRAALAEVKRTSVTITVPRLDAGAMGGLIALFERAVGLYGELVDINAYHQPGVEAGKRAAKVVLELQARVVAALGASPQLCTAIAGAADADPADVWPLLEHLAATRDDVQQRGADPALATFARGA